MLDFSPVIAYNIYVGNNIVIHSLDSTHIKISK